MRPVALNVREKEAISRANAFRGHLPFLFSKYQVLGKSETIKNMIVDISDLFRYYWTSVKVLKAAFPINSLLDKKIIFCYDFTLK